MGACCGCCQPTPFRNIYTNINHKYVRSCKSKFESLCLTEKEVGQLYFVFDLLDLKKTGIVTAYHLLTYLRCDTHNKFVKRMMYPMRKGLRFDGFVIALWDFCTVKQKHLAEFVYKVYDVEDASKILRNDMETLIEEVYGRDFTDKNGKISIQTTEIMTQLYGRDLLDQDAYVSLVKFCEFANRQKSVLFHAFRLQNSLIDGIVGRRFWVRQSAKRYNGNEIDLTVYRMLYEEISKGQRYRDDDDDDEYPPVESSQASVGGSAGGSSKGRQLRRGVSSVQQSSSGMTDEVASLLKDTMLIAGRPSSAQKIITDKQAQRVLEDQQRAMNGGMALTVNSRGSRHGGGGPPPPTTTTNVSGKVLAVNNADAYEGQGPVVSGKISRGAQSKSSSSSSIAVSDQQSKQMKGPRGGGGVEEMGSSPSPSQQRQNSQIMKRQQSMSTSSVSSVSLASESKVYVDMPSPLAGKPTEDMALAAVYSPSHSLGSSRSNKGGKKRKNKQQ